MAELEAAVSTLGWQLRPVVPARAVDLALWTQQIVDWELSPGPRAGLATVMTANTDPQQAVLLTVNLSQGINFKDYDDGPQYSEVEFARSAWSMLEHTLGSPATSWSGLGPRMLWERPDTNLALRLDRDQVVLEMMCTAFDSDARQEPRPLWRATESAAVPTGAPVRVEVTSWDDLRERLGAALRALCSDSPLFPATFRLHLRSMTDPKRYVITWNTHHTLGIEGPANDTDGPGPDHFTGLGWMRQHEVWRQWVDNTRFTPQRAEIAADRLVDALRAQQVELADLAYHGLIDGRDRQLTVELPELGSPRREPDAYTTLTPTWHGCRFLVPVVSGWRRLVTGLTKCR